MRQANGENGIVLDAETGAEVLKAQHPEFELWNKGVHAQSGVSCADCHMPYKREGALKVSDHWVRSPLLSESGSARWASPTWLPSPCTSDRP